MIKSQQTVSQVIFQWFIKYKEHQNIERQGLGVTALFARLEMKYIILYHFQ